MKTLMSQRQGAKRVFPPPPPLPTPQQAEVTRPPAVVEKSDGDAAVVVPQPKAPRNVKQQPKTDDGDDDADGDYAPTAEEDEADDDIEEDADEDDVKRDKKRKYAKLELSRLSEVATSIESVVDLKQYEQYVSSSDPTNVMEQVRDTMKKKSFKADPVQWMDDHEERYANEPAFVVLRRIVNDIYKIKKPESLPQKRPRRAGQQAAARIAAVTVTAGPSLEEWKSNLQKNISCPVCYELPHGPNVLTCGHVLCIKCLGEIKTRTNQCPTCRIPITNSILSCWIQNLLNSIEGKREHEITKLKETTYVSTPALRDARQNLTQDDRYDRITSLVSQFRGAGSREPVIATIRKDWRNDAFQQQLNAWIKINEPHGYTLTFDRTEGVLSIIPDGIAT